MLPFGRRVHLHKSASFNMILEQIQINPTNDAKFDPQNHLNIHQKTSKQILWKTLSTTQIYGKGFFPTLAGNKTCQNAQPI